MRTSLLLFAATATAVAAAMADPNDQWVVSTETAALAAATFGIFLIFAIAVQSTPPRPHAHARRFALRHVGAHPTSFLRLNSPDARDFISDINAHMAVPLSLLVLLVGLYAALAILNPPPTLAGTPLRPYLFTALNALLFLFTLFVYFRFVDVSRRALARTPPVAKSRMPELFAALAAPISVGAKLLGALLAFLVVMGLLNAAGAFTFQIFLAFVALATAAIVGAVVAALRGAVGEWQCAAALMTEDVLRAGEEVEVFARNFGRVRGRVESVGTRVASLVGADGGVLFVPNAVLHDAVVINHSRRRAAPVGVDLYVDPSAQPQALRALLEAVKKTLKESPFVDGDEKVRVALAFNPSYAHVSCIFSPRKGTPRQEAADEVALALHEAMGGVGVAWARGGGAEKYGPLTSFRTD
jgi:small-conductance mechanosensitive channel